jgi:hypothetical protein
LQAYCYREYVITADRFAIVFNSILKSNECTLTLSPSLPIFNEHSNGWLKRRKVKKKRKNEEKDNLREAPISMSFYERLK